MTELHKFLFEGLPVRGAIVRITDAWVEILRRRASNTHTGAYPHALQEMLGEMTAAAVLMQSNIKFDGALILQIFGDGPLNVAVVEVQSDLALRATATLKDGIPESASLGELINAHGKGRCAITLDPQNRAAGQQPYQGVVPLLDEHGIALKDIRSMLEQYMLKSEQLDTTLILAADERVAAGLLIQRLPATGGENLSKSAAIVASEDQLGANEDYSRIATLASSLKKEELLNLDAQTILHRLFWQEDVRLFENQDKSTFVRFACSCSRDRVGKMIVGLGKQEAQQIIAEQDVIEVACEYCGMQYRFDSIDAAQLFATPPQIAPDSSNRLPH